MIILITGASHTGKTLTAQRLMEKYKYPLLSIDHLKMGLIRSGNTDLTPESDDKLLTGYLWPIVREMIKTAIENEQNMIVEGCYIPFDWKKDFDSVYLENIRYFCLIMSEEYIISHFEDIKGYADVIEKRLEDNYTIEEALKDNKENLKQAKKHNVNYILTEDKWRKDMYKYLFWDIDGTILDFLASEEYAIKFLFEKYNLGKFSDEMLKCYSGINDKYWKRLELGEITRREVQVGRFREFLEVIGADTSLAESLNKDFMQILGEYVKFIENAKEVLLAQKGKYLLVAVTNGSKSVQEKKLKLSGLDEIFDEIFISEDVGAEKPNKEYFDYVFDKLGITDKKEVLIIGDSLSSDMKGGENAGIDTCWFNPDHKINKDGISITYETDRLDNLEKILTIVKE